MKPARTRPSRNTANLIVDVAIFLGFLVAMAPRFSGIAIHEWLSIAFGAAIITHLLLHWQWLVAVAKRFFSATSWPARVNYALNTLLFIDMTVVIFTGLMISETALPLFGLTLPRGGVWRPLHSLSADLAVVLIGLHLGLHWSWMVNTVRRLVLPRTQQRQAALATPLQKEA